MSRIQLEWEDDQGPDVDLVWKKKIEAIILGHLKSVDWRTGISEEEVHFCIDREESTNGPHVSRANPGHHQPLLKTRWRVFPPTSPLDHLLTTPPTPTHVSSDGPETPCLVSQVTEGKPSLPHYPSSTTLLPLLLPALPHLIF
jgi:hypothetical protein